MSVRRFERPPGRRPPGADGHVRLGTLPALIFVIGVTASCGSEDGASARTRVGTDSSRERIDRGSNLPNGAGEAGGPFVPAGSVIRLRLGDELDTQSTDVGQEFHAIVAEPLEVGGRVAIPSGARVDGLVTAVQARTENLAGVVKLAVRSITIAGAEVPITAAVSRVAVSRVRTAEDGPAEAGVTAAQGATPGRVIPGPGASSIVGEAVGGAAGTAIVLSNRDEVTVLRVGSDFEITLGEALYVRR